MQMLKTLQSFIDKALVDPFQFVSCETIRLKSCLIGIDHNYQRMVRRKLVEAIKSSFDQNAFGTLLVCRRPDGTYWVIDGQHRLTAAREKFGEDCMVPCTIVELPTVAAEAALFHLLGTQRAPLNPREKLLSDAAANSTDALAIYGVVEESGFKISRDGRKETWNTVKDTGCLQQVYDSWGGVSGLHDTLTLIASAWNEEPFATRSDVITGMGLFLFRCGTHNNFKRSRAIHKFSQVSGKELLRESRGMAVDMSTKHGTRAMAAALASLYNKGLQVNSRIEPFDI